MAPTILDEFKVGRLFAVTDAALPVRQGGAQIAQEAYLAAAERASAFVHHP
jgi:hypothetical protein